MSTNGGNLYFWTMNAEGSKSYIFHITWELPLYVKELYTLESGLSEYTLEEEVAASTWMANAPKNSRKLLLIIPKPPEGSRFMKFDEEDYVPMKKGGFVIDPEYITTTIDEGKFYIESGKREFKIIPYEEDVRFVRNNLEKETKEAIMVVYDLENMNNENKFYVLHRLLHHLQFLYEMEDYRYYDPFVIGFYYGYPDHPWRGMYLVCGRPTRFYVLDEE